MSESEPDRILTDHKLLYRAVARIGTLEHSINRLWSLAAMLGVAILIDALTTILLVTK